LEEQKPGQGLTNKRDSVENGLCKAIRNLPSNVEAVTVNLGRSPCLPNMNTVANRLAGNICIDVPVTTSFLAVFTKGNDGEFGLEFAVSLS